MINNLVEIDKCFGHFTKEDIQWTKSRHVQIISH